MCKVREWKCIGALRVLQSRRIIIRTKVLRTTHHNSQSRICSLHSLMTFSALMSFCPCTEGHQTMETVYFFAHWSRSTVAKIRHICSVRKFRNFTTHLLCPKIPEFYDTSVLLCNCYATGCSEQQSVKVVRLHPPDYMLLLCPFYTVSMVWWPSVHWWASAHAQKQFPLSLTLFCVLREKRNCFWHW